MLKQHIPYHELGATTYDTQQRERDLAILRKRATKLGAVLIIPTEQPTGST